jgi:hypothetical protein
VQRFGSCCGKDTIILNVSASCCSEVKKSRLKQQNWVMHSKEQIAAYSDVYYELVVVWLSDAGRSWRSSHVCEHGIEHVSLLFWFDSLMCSDESTPAPPSKHGAYLNIFTRRADCDARLPPSVQSDTNLTEKTFQVNDENCLKHTERTNLAYFISSTRTRRFSSAINISHLTACFKVKSKACNVATRAAQTRREKTAQS